MMSSLYSTGKTTTTEKKNSDVKMVSADNTKESSSSMDAEAVELSMDAEALRSAVQEVRRGIDREKREHFGRMEALEEQIVKRTKELVELKESPDILDAKTRAEWREIVAHGRATAVPAPPTPTVVGDKATALRERLTTVLETLDDVDLSTHRRDLLQRESRVLERIVSNDEETPRRGTPSRRTSSWATWRSWSSSSVTSSELPRVEVLKLVKENEELIRTESEVFLRSKQQGDTFVDVEFPPKPRTKTALLCRRCGEIGPDDSSCCDLKVSSTKFGDEWLASAVAAVVLTSPEALRTAITTGDKGQYRVRICEGGLRHTVTIDDFLPCDTSGSLVVDSRFAFIEKAVAKLRGSSKLLRSGSIAEGLLDVTASPTLSLAIDDTTFAQLERANAIVVAFIENDDRAYPINAITSVDDRRLVRLCDVWGHRQFTSVAGLKWWTPEFRAKLAAQLGSTSAEVQSVGTWLTFDQLVDQFTAWTVALPVTMASRPWYEARARVHLKKQRTQVVRLHLSEASSRLYVTAYNQTLSDASHIGLAIFRDGSQVAAAQDPKARYLVCPASLDMRSWAPGNYVVCIYSPKRRVAAVSVHAEANVVLSTMNYDSDLVHRALSSFNY